MGSCLSKPSSKGQKKKKGTSSTEDWDGSEKQKQPCSEKDAGKAVPSIPVDAAPCSPALSQAKQVEPSTLPSLRTEATFAKSDKPKLPPVSTPVRQPSPPPSFSSDPVTLPLTGQTPSTKKLSGEQPMNPLRKPSSPCKSLLLNMPPSPGLKKSVTRNEEDECKFPSLARKQWLSQAYVAAASKAPGADDISTEGSKANVRENINKEKTLCDAETLTLTRSLGSKDLSADAMGQMNNRYEAKPMAMENTTRLSATETATLAGKSVSSRTNSLSRDLSPVELSRAKARPSSPLKRSPSISATDAGTRLTRSASGKIASPNRTGFHAAERHDSMKARPFHKQSLSKESLTDPFADTSAHKRSSSRDSVSEYSAEIIRRPSPPKKTPIIPSSAPLLSSMEGSKLAGKWSSTPGKENATSHKPAIQDPSSIARGGRMSAQRNLSSAAPEPDNLTVGNNNRNVKRKEKSPLRRTCNGMPTLQSSTRMGDRNADLSVNSDTSQFDHLVKDSAARTRKSSIRTPLKEISENSTKLASSKQGLKDANEAPIKTRNELTIQKENVPQKLHSTEETTKGYVSLGKYEENSMLDMANNLNDYVKDPLEAKAENLVMGGKSVLSAFKALEEYRLKYPNLNLEPRKDAKEDVWYSRQQQPQTSDKENCSQPLQGLDMEKDLPKANMPELPRSRSTKKSWEQFFFPDVHSLLMSENEGMQLEEGLTMPASISKACSILRAVADLNMGAPMYPKKKDAQDEIERPNLLSFQFGEGDSHRVTSG